MRRGEAPGSDGPKTAISSVRQPSEATIRLKRSPRERVTLAQLRASLPALEPLEEALSEPITKDVPVLHPPPSGATPHTIVLPSTTRLERATLTMLRGPGVGTTFTLDQEETILGRGVKADIFLDEPSVSRHHASITLDGDGQYFIEDLGSTNGTFVGGSPVQHAHLKNGDRVQIGGEYTFRFALLDEEEETLQRRLYDSSTRDTLTGLMNRACLFEQLATAIERSRRGGPDLAVMIIDADFFKSVNDRFGHAAGDEVLKSIAIAGARVVGDNHLFARYGGEEFAVLMRAAAVGEAEALAERIRGGVRELRFEVGAGAIGITVSIGVARLSECEIVDGLELFARADARLYAAKLAGRDRVCARE